METDAFKICESDRMIGLTWREVEKCEVSQLNIFWDIYGLTLQERFGAMLLEQGIPLPIEEEFDNADLNGDGTLLFEEWEEFVEFQSSEDDDSSED